MQWHMKNLIVVIPGIMGSALADKNHNELWGPLPSAMLTYIGSLGKSLDALVLDPHKDDPSEEVLADGIHASRLLLYTLFPGLATFDGYTALRVKLHEEFQLVEGDPRKEDGPPANYFEFPYDWRRRNEAAARQLKKLIDRELPKWQEKHEDAKVIILAHSMGGLVAQYYLEVLEGYQKTLTLITFGTPYRGALKSLDFLTNGFRLKKWGMKFPEVHRFSELLRSFSSTYELLPTYPCVKEQEDPVTTQNIQEKQRGLWKNLEDIEHPFLSRDRVKAALTFHKNINAHYERNQQNDNYELQIIPVQGKGHSTLQSARITPSKEIIMSQTIFPDDDEARAKKFLGGDGTVPRFSAFPKHLYKFPGRWKLTNQKHATIQSCPTLLEDLTDTLRFLQDMGQGPALGVGEDQNEVSLDLDEAYLKDEPVVMGVKVHSQVDPQTVSADVHPLGHTSEDPPIKTVIFDQDQEDWVGTVVGLSPGSYRVTIKLGEELAGPKDSVQDIFEVMESG